MKMEIEGEVGSWELEVGSFHYLVVYAERQEPKYFRGQSFISSVFQALFFKNVS